MAKSGKPSTSGKKPRKGATKKASKHIHSIVENASGLQFNNCTLVNQLPQVPHMCSLLSTVTTSSPSGSFVPQLSEASVQLSQKPASNGSDSISQSSTQPSIQDATPLPIFTAMQAPFYNYGFQSLGQSMHYYPCPPLPLIPLAPVFSPPHGPKSAVHIQTPTVVQQEPRPSVSSPLWLCFV